MEFGTAAAFDGTCGADEGNSRRGGRMSRRRHNGGDEPEGGFKSKNLNAERKRRAKLSHRLLDLRALVPIITNMNKATIITDAMTYIEELQKCVRELSDQLLEPESTIIDLEEHKPEIEEIDAADEMRKWGIEQEVKVTRIDANKLWIKIVFEKKRGGFTKLVEAMNVLGFDFADTTVTTSRGAFLVTASLEDVHGRIDAADQIRELLLQIIKGI